MDNPEVNTSFCLCWILHLNLGVLNVIPHSVHVGLTILGVHDSSLHYAGVGLRLHYVYMIHHFILWVLD